MTKNFRSASFALLSGAVLMVGSSMAFANPDQTNPREGAISNACAGGATDCETVSQDTSSVTSGAVVSGAVTDPSAVTVDHDARKNRSHVKGK